MAMRHPTNHGKYLLSPRELAEFDHVSPLVLGMRSRQHLGRALAQIGRRAYNVSRDPSKCHNPLYHHLLPETLAAFLHTPLDSDAAALALFDFMFPVAPPLVHVTANVENPAWFTWLNAGARQELWDSGALDPDGPAVRAIFTRCSHPREYLGRVLLECVARAAVNARSADVEFIVKVAELGTPWARGAAMRTLSAHVSAETLFRADPRMCWLPSMRAGAYFSTFMCAFVLARAWAMRARRRIRARRLVPDLAMLAPMACYGFPGGDLFRQASREFHAHRGEFAAGAGCPPLPDRQLDATGPGLLSAPVPDGPQRLRAERLVVALPHVDVLLHLRGDAEPSECAQRVEIDPRDPNPRALLVPALRMRTWAELARPDSAVAQNKYVVHTDTGVYFLDVARARRAVAHCRRHAVARLLSLPRGELRAEMEFWAAWRRVAQRCTESVGMCICVSAEPAARRFAATRELGIKPVLPTEPAQVTRAATVLLARDWDAAMLQQFRRLVPTRVLLAVAQDRDVPANCTLVSHEPAGRWGVVVALL